MSKSNIESVGFQLHLSSQASIAFPSTMGPQSSSSPAKGKTQAWKGALEEGKRKPKCLLKADGVWKRKPCLATRGNRNQITGEVRKAAVKKELKEVVIKCEAGDFQGIVRRWQKVSPGQFQGCAPTLFFIAFLY